MTKDPPGPKETGGPPMEYRAPISQKPYHTCYQILTQRLLPPRKWHLEFSTLVQLVGILNRPGIGSAANLSLQIGYIGGHALDLLVKKHPEYQIVALVRNNEQAVKLKAAFPNIETVIGDLDSEGVLVREANSANIVIKVSYADTASSDHSPGSRALVQGLGQGTKGNLIHVSGTGILRDVSTGYGNESSKIYHDASVADIAEIVSFDSTHPHQDTEKVIRTTAKAEAVPFAILCPPTIYGIGKGAIKTRSIQIPQLVETMLKRGRAFQILEGQNFWDSEILFFFTPTNICTRGMATDTGVVILDVHVDDVASALVLLTEEAVKGEASKAEWGDAGYYFTGAAEHQWATICTSLANILHAKGKLPTAEVDKLPVEVVSQLHPWGLELWGGNSRSRAERFRELGWEPRGLDILASLEQMVDKEIETLGTV
ncbi:MAG: hypothetical protein M1839_000991 [Geoglossum umbratile]|nr:MAG: hypothetical protein M1839_000991 [Geoglossum umbratile]